jgi:cytochrome c biogenesis protein
LAKQPNAVRSFFSSVTLTIVLLGLIALLAIIGTLAPQQDEAARLMERLSPGAVSILRTFQVFDIFHSIWFITLLVLLLVNLVVCSLNRLPITWKQYRRAAEPVKPEAWDRVRYDASIESSRPLHDAAARLDHFFKKKHGRLERFDTNDGALFRWSKGAFSPFGVYIVHLSVLLILIGVVLGSLLGFDGYMEIAEGESADAVILKGGRGGRPLDFTVRCDRFILENYPDGTPKTYQSDVAFLKKGRIVKSGSLRVNHPLEFEGVRFYQSSYGKAAGGKNVLIVKRGAEKLKELIPVIGEELPLDGSEALVKVIRVEDNFMGMGPAVKIAVKTGNNRLDLWIFQNIETMKRDNPGLLEQAPMFNPALYKPYSFSIGQTGTAYYTGLQVNHDPGIYLVGAGAFLLVVGFLWVFFYDYRQIWVRLETGDAQTKLSVAGRSNKHHAGLDRDVSRLLGHINAREGTDD